jgi:ferredoxin
MSRELVVDWTRCDGHGLCARLLPEAVSLDEWGFPVIDSIAEVDPAAVRTAIASCPRLALRVEKTRSGSVKVRKG